jgi:hypothetical protein
VGDDDEEGYDEVEGDVDDDGENEIDGDVVVILRMSSGRTRMLHVTIPPDESDMLGLVSSAHSLPSSPIQLRFEQDLEKYSIEFDDEDDDDEFDTPPPTPPPLPS